MVIDESSRHAMFSRLQDVLGKEHAAVLMEHLPPVGWADVATKRDLDQLRAWTAARLDAVDIKLNSLERGANALDHCLERIERRVDDLFDGTNARFDGVNNRFDQVNARIDALTRTMIYTVLTAVVSVGGLAFAAARLV